MVSHENDLPNDQKNFLPFIEPIREVVRQNSLTDVLISDAIVSKEHHNWLSKLSFHNINQSERPVVLLWGICILFLCDLLLMFCDSVLSKYL